MRANRYYVLFLLLAVYTTNYLDRTILNSVLEPIKQEFHLSDSALGLLTGFTFALFYASLGIPLAMAADRWNRRNIIALSAAIWSGMTVLSGLAQNFWQLAAARIGVGIGEAGGTPPAHSMIADLFPPEKRGTAMGIYSFGIPIGVLFGFLVGGHIAASWGWRAAFLFMGAPGLVFAALVRLTLAEPARGTLEFGDRHTAAPPPLAQAIAALFRRRSMVHLTIGSTVFTLAGFAQQVFVSSFLSRTHHMGLAERSTYLALVLGLGGVIGNFATGSLFDRLGKRDPRWKVWLVALIYLAVMPIAVTAVLIDDTTTALTLLVIPYMTPSLYLVALWALTPSLVGLRMRALASAFLLFLMSLIGLGGGPYLMGLVSDLLRPRFGDQSLRYAMLSAVILGLWGIAHFAAAAKTLAADIDATRRAEQESLSDDSAPCAYAEGGAA